MRASRLPSVVPTSGRRAIAAVIAVIVVGVAFVPPAAAVGRSAPLRAAASADCPVEVSDEASAVDTAVRCGREVEVLDERTEWQTLHALPDGQMRLDTSVSAQRTRVSGEWTEIDTSLVETAEGIAPTAPAVEMVFSDGTRGLPLVRMQREGHEFTFDVPFEVGAPVVYGTTLEYRDVLEGVDLIVTVNEDGTGFSEVLRIDSPQAAADPRIAALRFPLTASDGLEVEEANGGFVATDADGDEVFTSPPPAMWDSRADRTAPKLTPRLTGLSSGTTGGVSLANEVLVANRAARVEAPLESDAAAVMGVDVDTDAVVVKPDAEMLGDPATVWPVYIDPSVGSYPSAWISIRNDGWSDYNYSGDQGVGYCGTTGSPMYCSKIFTRRAMWLFGGLQAVGDVDPADVSQATMWVYGSHSYSCTAYPVQAWRTGVFSSGTTWATSSWGAHQSTQSLAHKPACNNARFIGFDVLEGARAVASVNANSLSLGLKAENEGSSTGWKRYEGSTASLSITYNRRPSTPTNPYMTNTVSGPSLGCGTSAAPTYVRTLTPSVWATMSDPDGGNVMAWFDLFQGSTLIWDGGQTAAQASGQRHTVQIPAGKVTEGVTYAWNAFSFDGAVHSLNGVACAFIADVTAPAVPTVGPAPGRDAEYTSAGPAGGVDVAGAFIFDSSSPDVYVYDYVLNGGQETGTVIHDAAAGQSLPMEFEPSSPGPQRIEVTARDRAGNVSGTVTYRFYVAFPGSAGEWLLDETPPSATCPDTVVPGHPLMVSDPARWGDGLLADFGFDPDDRALLFDTSGDTAVTSGPVVAADGSFSVMAFARLDDATATATAVSQDGTSASGFELGYRTTGCPGGASGCWAFAMNTSDSASAPAPTIVASSVPVVAGSWVQLTGVHNAATNTISLYVCELGTPAEPVGSPSPVRAAPVAHTTTWNQTGPFVIGRGRAAVAAANPWRGAVSAVAVYDAALEPAPGESQNTDVLTACQSGVPAPVAD